jgi:4-amino-4-deoxy-L-arabinose transferase-like glycosyltransferase
MVVLDKKIVSKFSLLSILIFLYLFGLGNRPFATPDEGRYVEIPREMVQNSDYITPRLNGVKYFEKPPLFYWLQAASIKTLGMGEFSMRLWTVVFALMGCFATYYFAGQFYGNQAGLFSAFILGTSVLYFSLGRLIILDMPVSVLSTLSLFSFFKAFHTKNLFHRRFWFYGFAIFCALGVLTKGVMTLAIAGPVIVIWLTVTRSWGALAPVFFPSALLLFLLVAAPWHVLVALKNPEFVHKYFIVEHILRYTTDVHLRTKPFYFFLPVLLLGALPWVFFMPPALRRLFQHQKPVDIFLLVWMVWVFVFFSLSNSKLVPYILPMFPPLSICLGAYLSSEASQNYKWGFFFLRFFGLVIAPAAYIIITHYTDIFVGKESVHPYAVALVSIFAGTAALSYFIRHHTGRLNMLVGTSLLVVFTLIFAAPKIQRPSIKSFANYINQHKKSGDLVISFMAYYQDLPVYTQGTVTVIEAKGELEFGTQVEDTESWMVSLEKFQDLWQNPPATLWIVARKTELVTYQQKYPTFLPIQLVEDNGNVLVKISPMRS